MKRPIVLFLAASFLLQGLVFRGAFLGSSLLAPLDIAPAFFAKYAFLSDSAIPANHYVIDQLTHDLPVQFTIYQAYRRGEMPWWDPYTYGGEPLLADGHINGTDVVRVFVYLTLPFEWAYNWTRILHFFLAGLGMYLMLRRFGFSDWLCVWLALTYEFAGCQTVFFAHPWIQGSFVYYPFLWLTWDAAYRDPKRWQIIAATLLVCGIFLAGSLQTHSYLLLFACAFGLGYAGLKVNEWRRLFPVVALPILLGACLTAPILAGQVELFLLSKRTLVLVEYRRTWLAAIGSLSAFFPWCLGTFRTLDLGKFVGQDGLGFNLFIGSAAFVLSLLGVFLRDHRSLWHKPRRTAILLVALYFVILSTPLMKFFYTRAAGLAVMGLIVLAASGVTSLARDERPFRRSGKWILGTVALIALVCNLFAWTIYPRLVPHVRQFVQAQESTAGVLPAPRSFREFQIRQLPGEISFENPETVLACLGLILLAGLLLRPQWRRQPSFWLTLSVLNSLPLISFCQRYVPHQPMAMWQRLLEGGQEQRKVMTQLAGTPQRLREVAPNPFDFVFPANLGHLYRLRTVHGYGSLPLPSIAHLPPESYSAQIADWIYETNDAGKTGGILRSNAISGLSRFQWRDATSRVFSVRDIGLNVIELRVEPGPEGQLLWTDSRCPGWTARVDGQPVALEKFGPCFSVLNVPANATLIAMNYEPTYLKKGLVLTMAAAAVTALMVMRPRRSAKNSSHQYLPDDCSRSD